MMNETALTSTETSTIETDEPEERTGATFASKTREDLIRGAEASGFTPEEAAFMVDTMFTQLETIRASERGDAEARLTRWIQEQRVIAERLSESATRHAALVSAARARIQAVVDTVKAGGGDVADALEMLLLGSGRFSGGTESVSRLGAGLRALWAGSLADEVKESGVLPLLRDDARFSELVMREMAEPESTGDASARRTADLFSRYLAYMARELDECGARIGGLAGYVPHSHDSLKLRRVGEEGWVKRVVRWIDPGRTFPGLEAEAIPAALSDFFQALIVGGRPTCRHGINPFLPFGLAGADSRQDCILYFNSAESAVKYSRYFASGGITKGMLRVVDGFARRAALMRVFGPNPEAMIREFLEREALSLPPGDAGRERVLTVKRCFRALAGESGTPENLTAARVMAEKRVLRGMIRLGEAFASSFADIAARLGARGGNFWNEDEDVWLQEWDVGLRGCLERFPPEERRELARRLDMHCAALLGELYGTFDLTDARSGDMTRWMNAWYALCALKDWTSPHRAACAVSFSNCLARFAVAGEGGADKRFATALRGNGLLDRLDLLRTMVEEVEGEPYLFPENVARLTDAELEAHLPEAVRSQARSLPPRQWEEARSAACAQLRETLARDLADVFAGEISCILRDPLVKRRVCLPDMSRTDPLTAEMRYLSKKMGKNFIFWWQDENTRLRVTFPHKKTLEDVPGFIHFFTAGTAIGMVSLTARAFAAGRDEPNDWQEPLLPTMLAILRSGAFGVLGHFYLGMAGRFNKRGWFGFSPQVTEAVAGMSDLSARLARGEFPDRGEELVRRALDGLPFVNLLYARQAMEYLVYYHIANDFAYSQYTMPDDFIACDWPKLQRLEAFSTRHF